MAIDPNGADASYAFDGEMKVKGRGHSTWEMPKKPYKLKLASKASLFGFPADKEWILLANYADKTLLRNSVAMELSRRFGLAYTPQPYTPRSRPVELFLNGAYQGTYLFIEQIKIAKERVDIEPMMTTGTAGEALTGGYLLEVDTRLDEPFHFVTDRYVSFNMKDPDGSVPEQLEYIRAYVQQAEDVLYSEEFADPESGYASTLAVDTFVDWILVNEIFKNADAQLLGSCWMTKQRGDGKLSMGPVWD
jgi:hypothetical protein